MAPVMCGLNVLSFFINFTERWRKYRNLAGCVSERKRALYSLTSSSITELSGRISPLMRTLPRIIMAAFRLAALYVAPSSAIMRAAAIAISCRKLAISLEW